MVENKNLNIILHSIHNKSTWSSSDSLLNQVNLMKWNNSFIFIKFRVLTIKTLKNQIFANWQWFGKTSLPNG